MDREIAVSILGQNDKKKLITEIISAVSRIHYDVMDGKYVQSTSLPWEETIDLFSHTPKHIKDVHLMVEKPLTLVKKYLGLADYLSFHIEAISTSDLEIITSLKRKGTKLGLAIDLFTSIEIALPVLSLFDYVLIMSVKAGKGGQTFDESALAKIKKIRTSYPELPIQVDGGITDKCAAQLFEAGANCLVSGSFFISKYKDFSSWRALFCVCF